MSNIFANYRSGDIDPSSMKPSVKVSEIVNNTFMILNLKKLEGKSKYSDDPVILVNAKDDSGNEFVFFASQKVLCDKLTYLIDRIDHGITDVYSAEYMIVKTETKDGESFYYDIIDVSE